MWSLGRMGYVLLDRSEAGLLLGAVKMSLNGERVLAFGFPNGSGNRDPQEGWLEKMVVGRGHRVKKKIWGGRP